MSTDVAANPEMDFVTFSGSALYFGIIAGKEIVEGGAPPGKQHERNIRGTEHEPHHDAIGALVCVCT